MRFPNILPNIVTNNCTLMIRPLSLVALVLLDSSDYPGCNSVRTDKIYTNKFGTSEISF